MLYCGIEQTNKSRVEHEIFMDIKQKACSILAVPAVSERLESRRIETAAESHKLYAAVLDGLLTTPYQLSVATDGCWFWSLQSLTPRNAVCIEPGHPAYVEYWSSPIMATAFVSSDFVRHAAAALCDIASDIETFDPENRWKHSDKKVRTEGVELHVDPWLTGAAHDAWSALKDLCEGNSKWFSLPNIADNCPGVELQTIKNLSTELQEREYFIKSNGQGFRAGTGKVLKIHT